MGVEAPAAGAGQQTGAGGTGDTGGAGGTGGTGATGGTGGTGTVPAKFDWGTVGLDADAKSVVDAHQWENPGSLVKSYSNLLKMQGVPADRLLKMPNDKSTPEEWKEYHTKIGVPATPADYKLPVPEGDKGEFAREAAKWFHDAGIPAGAATKVATAWNEKVKAGMEAATNQRKADTEKQMGELKTEWGVDFDKNVEMVNNAGKQFGMNEQQLDALKYALGYKGAMQFMKNIGAKVGSEPDFIAPDKTGSTGDINANMSAEQAQAKLTQLKGDKAFQQMYMSKDPKTRKDARDTVDRLSRLAGPGFTTFQGPAR